MENTFLTPEEQTRNLTTSIVNEAQAVPPPRVEKPVPEEDDIYYLEGDDLEAASSLVTPFQVSNELPPLSPKTAWTRQTASAAESPGTHSTSSSPPARKKRRRPSLLTITIIGCLLLLLGMVLLNALSQTTPPLRAGTPTARTGQVPGHAATPRPTARPAASAVAPAPPQATPAPSAENGMPQQLPAGWSAAGLTMADALEAQQVASTFTEREMTLDYRSIGTRDQHGGTMTASTFLLTPAALQRFLRNDVRMMNNTLFDQVARTKLIRMTLLDPPQVLRFTTQGQQQCALVDVPFHYWISQLDPQTGKRTEGLEVIAGTTQPHTHHLGIVLLRVLPTTPDVNVPMGGTGWLVSNYALDLPAGEVPIIVQPA